MALGGVDLYAEEVADLLAIDNGRWDTFKVYHHCRGLFCCPNGVQETRHKLWNAIVAPQMNTTVGV